ncbi:hypothetical protein Efla_000727 [Eimeria flavescens]
MCKTSSTAIPFSRRAISFIAPSLALAAFGGTIGPHAPSHELFVKLPNDSQVLIDNHDMAIDEGHVTAQTGWGGSVQWSRKKQAPHLPMAATVSLLVTVAVAFLVMQCFKSIGQPHRAAYLARRLSDDTDSESEDEEVCLVSKNNAVTCWAPPTLGEE